MGKGRRTRIVLDDRGNKIDTRKRARDEDAVSLASSIHPSIHPPTHTQLLLSPKAEDDVRTKVIYKWKRERK